MARGTALSIPINAYATGNYGQGPSVTPKPSTAGDPCLPTAAFNAPASRINTSTADLLVKRMDIVSRARETAHAPRARPGYRVAVEPSPTISTPH